MFFTIFPILMLPIKKLKTSHFIIWLAQRVRNKSANTSARIGFLNAGQDHIGLDFSFRSQKKIFFLSYVKSFFGQAYSITTGYTLAPLKTQKKNLAKMCSHINPMHAWKCCETGFNPEGKIPRRHPSSSRVYIGKYLQLKYAVGIQKESRFAWQWPHGIVR